MSTKPFEPDRRSLKLCSIIVLNFNGERIIEKCLSHLLNQTYPNFEIIIVDNNSTDNSLAILQKYLPSQKISLIRSKKNLGVPGGRNMGVLHARGEIVAFIDNDGYAHPDWLEEAVRTIESDEQIGAVASLVFFNKKKTIVNGAGGTLNLQGYGGDICFHQPYEFARLPELVLYPMGCGMVVKKEVLERVGPLDDLLFNYYDDVELGIRIWKLGLRVVLSPGAWVDHDFSVSDELNRNKVSLCERNRIRTHLKYFPTKTFLHWLVLETRHCRHHFLLKRTLLKGWIWNITHIVSALKWRARFKPYKGSFQNLLNQSWGFFPPTVPNNQVFQPDLKRVGNRLTIDGKKDLHQLNFGWYQREEISKFYYRWTCEQASALFRVTFHTKSCSMEFFSAREGRVRFVILIRKLGEIDPLVEIPVEADARSWQNMSCDCRLEPGLYELLVLTETVHIDPSGRVLGIAVASIELD